MSVNELHVSVLYYIVSAFDSTDVSFRCHLTMCSGRILYMGYEMYARVNNFYIIYTLYKINIMYTKLCWIIHNYKVHGVLLAYKVRIYTRKVTSIHSSLACGPVHCECSAAQSIQLLLNGLQLEQRRE